MLQNQNPKRKSAAEMKVVGSGKTVMEAQADALAKLEEAAAETFRKDEVEFLVLSEGSKGFLGMGSALAQVEASLPGEDEEPAGGYGTESAGAGGLEPDESYGEAEEDFEPAGPEAEARLEELLGAILSGMALDATVAISDGYSTLVGNISGDDLGLLIGRHGQTIDAIQYLANIIVFRGMPSRKRVIIDAEDYRERRNDVLVGLAERAAAEVLKGKHRYELKPMSAAERRIIHVHLQDRKGIQTESEGNEPFRFVVVTRS